MTTALKWYVITAILVSLLLLLLFCATARAGDFEDIAVTIAAEACGEGPHGMLLVAETVRNRAIAWNKTPGQIVRQKNQYYGFTAVNRLVLYSQCQAVADRLATALIEGSLGSDYTLGALYFLRPGEKVRKWHGKRTIEYLGHTFYRGRI